MLRPLLSKVRRKLDQCRLRSYRDPSSLIHEKLGTQYGGWYVPVKLFGASSTCYCVGAGEDVSFDVELITRFGCEVDTFDPTPRASQHIERLKQNAALGQSTSVHSGPTQYNVNSSALSRLHFHPYGLWDEHKTMRFYAPQNPTYVSHSLVNLQHTDAYFEAECRTVRQIMTELQHSDLTLLKLDIEGAEYKVLDSLLADQIFPAVICVEFDEGHTPQDGGYFDRITDAIIKLKKVGYRATYFDLWNVTFVRDRQCQGGAFATSTV